MGGESILDLDSREPWTFPFRGVTSRLELLSHCARGWAEGLWGGSEEFRVLGTGVDTAVLMAALPAFSPRPRADQANVAALLAPGPLAGLGVDRFTEGLVTFSPCLLDRSVVLMEYLSGLGDLETLCPGAGMVTGDWGFADDE